MGYYVDNVNSVFRIPADKTAPALKALKDNPPNAWVDDVKLKHAKNLKEGLSACRWEATMDPDDDGDVVNISFNGQKLGDDELMFEALAPFVDYDSFVEMRGEDGAWWRWVFRFGKVYEVNPTVTWPDL